MRSEEFARTLDDARAGQGLALGALFRDLHPRVLRYLQAFSPSDAEDLATDTWLDVTSALDLFRGDQRELRALALMIARNRLLDLQPEVRRSIPPVFHGLTPDGTPSGDGETGFVDDDPRPSGTSPDTEIPIGAALAQIAALPRSQADVVLLTILGELSVEEVARMVGTRPDTVRVIQHQALVRLFQQSRREQVPR